MIRDDHWYAFAVGDRSSVDLVTFKPCHLMAAMFNIRDRHASRPQDAALERFVCQRTDR